MTTSGTNLSQVDSQNDNIAETDESSNISYDGDDDNFGGILFTRGVAVRQSTPTTTKGIQQRKQQQCSGRIAVEEDAIIHCLHAAVQSHDATAVCDLWTPSPLFRNNDSEKHQRDDFNVDDRELSQWNPAELALPLWAVSVAIGATTPLEQEQAFTNPMEGTSE